VSHIISCCNNVFSLWQTDGHRYHDSPLRKISSWMENCTKFGQLILSKIIKIVATSCHILRLKCTNSISAEAPPRPHWRSSQRSPDSLTGFKGPTSKGRGKGKGRAGRERGGEEERGREEGEEGRGRREGRGSLDYCLGRLSV